MKLRRSKRQRLATRKTQRSLPWRVRLERLEARALLSSAGWDGAADHSITISNDALLQNWLGDDAVPVSGSTDSLETVTVAEPGPFVAADLAGNLRRELVFVNYDVPDYRAFLRELTANASQDGRIFEVVFLRPGDGLEQITAALGQRETAFDAVHFITHAGNGAVKFGDEWIRIDDFAANRERIAAWRSALSENADLLFYGCDLAGTVAGQQLLRAFYETTGADVAASDDRTGSAALGGDWSLEYRLGAVETDVAVGRDFQVSYDGVLATFTVTTALDAGIGSLRQAILNANSNPGADSIVFSIGSGLQTIHLLSALPTITDSVVIDATTQPGFAGMPLIELRGTLAGAASGLQINGDNVTLRGFIINDFTSGGIDITGTGHVIQGNYIGTDATGKNKLSNDRQGILVGPAGATSNVLIGGAAPGDGNIIAFNEGDGIEVRNATGVAIRGNSIFANDGLAIDLGGNGVTVNDIGDIDTGANNLQNFPVLNSAVSYNNALVTITGTVRSTPSTLLILDFYASTTADPSGFGEGATYLGSTIVTTDANGFANIAVQFAASVPLGDVIAATATNSTGDTSEFSAAIAVTPSSDGNAVWTSASNNVPKQSAWNGTTFGTISNTSNINGPIQVMQAAEAPTRDEIILIGVDSAGAVRGEMWDGTAWSALPFNPLATLTTSSRWAATVAYESQSGDAILIWANGATGTQGLSYRVWDGTSWSAEQTITTPIASEAYQLRVASNPNSDELTLIVATNGPEEYALVWDGNSWGNGIVLDSTGAGGQQTEVYVTYETQSGDALIVFDADAPGNTLQYRTWDGSSWSAQQTITPSIDPGSDVRFTVLASDQFSDRIALGAIAELGETWFMIWDGSAWGSELVATLNGNSTTTLNVSVAFEGQSGDLLAVYGESGAIRYRTWSVSGGWSAQQTGPDLGGATPTAMTLSADPFSDYIMLAVQDSNGDLTYADWTGSAWGSPAVQEINLDPAAKQPFVFLWDNTPLSNYPPTITFTGGPVTYTENAPPVVVAATATVVDPDGTDFDGGTLTVYLAAGGSVDDRLTVRNVGAGPGQIGVSGSTITYSGIAIATFTGGDGLDPLLITFNSNATTTEVEAVIQNVIFSNISDSPTTTDRTVEFQLTDGDGGTSNLVSNTVSVTAINDAPAWTIPGPQTTNEDTPLIFLTGNGNRISVNDADAGAGLLEVTISVTNGTVSLNGVTGLSFSVGDGTADAAMQFTGTLADINAALDGMTFTPSADFNGGAAIDLLTDDLGNTGSGGSLTDAASVGITVAPVNDGPVLIANNLTVSEGQTVALTSANLNTADPENSPSELIYAVTNVTGGQFELASSPGTAITSFSQAQVNAGEVVFVHDGNEAAPSYDVTVTDGALSDGPQAAAITFTNVNDPPVISDQTFAILENTPAGSQVATILATDPDTGETLTFSISASSVPGAFMIDPATGRLFVADGNAIDHEANPVITLTVTVQDSSGTSDSATVTAILQNVNEFSITSVFDADTGPNEVPENAAAGQLVGIRAFADDLDGPDTVTYSLDNDADGRFAIDPNTGVISITGPLDFEIEPRHLIVARATSADGSSATRTFAIRVTDEPDLFFPTSVVDPGLTSGTDTRHPRFDDALNNGFVVENSGNASGGGITLTGIDDRPTPKNVAALKGPPARLEDAGQLKPVRASEIVVPPPPVVTIEKPPVVVTMQEPAFGPVEGLQVQFEGVKKEAEQSVQMGTSGIAIGTGTITLVGVGSILLQTRLGAMLLSLISSVPMWRQFDPLSVLTAWEREKRKNRRELDREEQSLAPILG